MSAVKSSSATGYLYDASRDSWIACYPNHTFVTESPRERRANLVARRDVAPPSGLSEREIDASVWVIVVLQVVSVGYLLFSVRWF